MERETLLTALTVVFSLNIASAENAAKKKHCEVIRHTIENLTDRISYLENSEGAFMLANMEVTSDDLLNLTTPVELVPAPGPGKLIYVSRVLFIYNHATTAYSTSGARIGLHYSDGNGGLIELIINSVFTNSYFMRSYSPSNNVFFNADVNKPLVLVNTGTDLTLGDSTVTVKVEYTIEDIQ